MIATIYCLFFGLGLLSALMVVFLRHAVYSALSLIVTMVSIAGVFILINAQLAAFLQILVYAGAIMVLFLFVIMLMNLRESPPMPLVTRPIRRVAAILFIVFLIQSLILGVRSGAGSIFKEKLNARDATAAAASTPAASGGADASAENPPRTASINEVAVLLLTQYLYAFEMTSVLLLVAVIGAMVLARKSILEPSIRGESARLAKKAPTSA